MNPAELARKLNRVSARRPWRTAVLVALALAPAFALVGWLTDPAVGTAGFTVRWVLVSIVVLGFAGVVRHSRSFRRDRD